MITAHTFLMKFILYFNNPRLEMKGCFHDFRKICRFDTSMCDIYEKPERERSIP